jgi:heavy metal translocating P-type ATPase
MPQWSESSGVGRTSVGRLKLRISAWLEAAGACVTARAVRRAMIVIALTGLVLGLTAYAADRVSLARAILAAGTVPVLLGLALAIARDLVAGRMGVDAIAFLSMAVSLALGEVLAGAVVAVMYAGGNALEDFAVGRAERDLKSLVDRAPRVAHVLGDNRVEDVAVDAVMIGDRVLVRSGEVVPVDGALTSQAASLDEAALTGEPMPVDHEPGDAIRSGTINTGGTFEMCATATAGASTYAGIVRMVTAAQTAKSPFIRLADQFAILLLPLTVLLAIAAWRFSGDPVRGLAVLVAATPCPLILAAPVAFIAGVSQAARRGILIKGGAPLEALARARTLIFDKTGTLTVGGARLIAIEVAPNVHPDDVLRLTASLEQASSHVVSATIIAAARAKGLNLEMPTDIVETHGSGLAGCFGARTIRVGSYAYVSGAGAPDAWALRAMRRAASRSALSVFVAEDGAVIGALLLGDEIRRETPRALHALRANGVSRIIMVTGDRAEAANTIGAALNLDAVLADREPADKVDAVAAEQKVEATAMVGDGINDAPALAAASVGIAMGARGASASSEAADVVILVDQLDRVSEAVTIARRARRVALQSIWIGMSLSAIAMVAAAFGWLPPVAGALSQEVIDVAAILNALRALRPHRGFSGQRMSSPQMHALLQDHVRLDTELDRLRIIADRLDDCDPTTAVMLIAEASRITASTIVTHEQHDETVVYPQMNSYLARGHGLGALSRAHSEIAHQSRLLARLSESLSPDVADRYIIRDAQRMIETTETLVRLHNAQEEDIYEQAARY